MLTLISQAKYEELLSLVDARVRTERDLVRIVDTMGKEEWLAAGTLAIGFDGDDSEVIEFAKLLGLWAKPLACSA